MITLTANAAAKVKGILEQEKESLPQGGLRIYVQGGGCSGFQYGMVLDEVAEGDEVLEVGGREGHRRPDEPALPRGRRGRLQGRPDGRRLRDQEPEREVHLRLRPLVPGRRGRRAAALRCSSSRSSRCRTSSCSRTCRCRCTSSSRATARS